jgi:hypothetical protein
LQPKGLKPQLAEAFLFFLLFFLAAREIQLSRNSNILGRFELARADPRLGTSELFLHLAQLIRLVGNPLALPGEDVVCASQLLKVSAGPERAVLGPVPGNGPLGDFR